MSLKVFHIFFILVCIGFSGFFGVWCLQDAAETGNTLYRTLGITSFAVAVGLIAYLAWVVKKMRGFGFFSVPLLLGLMPSESFACAVCIGNPSSPLVQAANDGVGFMLVIVGGVLTSFLSLFLFWAWRAHKLSKLGA